MDSKDKKSYYSDVSDSDTEEPEELEVPGTDTKPYAKGRYITTQELNIEVLINRLERKDFIIPYWQREKIWREDQQSLFIDSIMAGYYIPPIAILPGPDEGTMVLDDGLQRLTSIQDFMSNKVCWKVTEDGDSKNTTKPLRLYFNSVPADLDNEKYINKVISAGDRKFFLNRSISVTNFPADKLPESFHTQLFSRLQNGTKAEPAELLKQTNNSIIKYISLYNDRMKNEEWYENFANQWVVGHKSGHRSEYIIIFFVVIVIELMGRKGKNFFVNNRYSPGDYFEQYKKNQDETEHKIVFPENTEKCDEKITRAIKMNCSILKGNKYIATFIKTRGSRIIYFHLLYNGLLDKSNFREILSDDKTKRIKSFLATKARIKLGKTLKLLDGEDDE